MTGRVLRHVALLERARASRERPCAEVGRVAVRTLRHQLRAEPFECGRCCEVFPSYQDQALGSSCGAMRSTPFPRLTLLARLFSGPFARAIYPKTHYSCRRAPSSVRSKRSARNLRVGTEAYRGRQAGRGAEASQRTMFDLELIKEMVVCRGIENYSRHLTGRSRASRPYATRLCSARHDDDY